ncbi:MAG: soluble lytic murein transglycosylase [Solirubrobacteraceae bacterium]|nr:soluble lytic murein transglycosylase [Solirubrobacteraceae bacterium]
MRRRRLALLGAAIVAAGAALALAPLLRHAVKEIALPLRHEDIIRQQARAKRLDPALIAAVIYAETKFVPRTSAAGAEGLMQILPATARFLARRSGGTAFREADLATPEVNIKYGSYYLRYLLDRYGQSEVLAAAAYNGGETNVDRWIGAARRRGAAFRIADIPYSETRQYVRRVLNAQRDYRRSYRRELGLG